MQPATTVRCSRSRSVQGLFDGAFGTVTAMRWSTLHTPTLRDTPADAEASSHRLLIRGGFIRQLHAGHYSLLPLGWRVFAKVENIVREEMNAIGGQEFLLPAMHPASLWKKSGRWDLMGEEMFRLVDRKGGDLAMGMTHEEVFAELATEINSYRSLPQIWYQIQTKFRDEPRPKSGLLRIREFKMKDSYSFDIDQAGLDGSFALHHQAYVRIFERLGVPAIPVDASSGAMGGTGSVEFMIPSSAGEDDVVRCGNCDYAANIERATSKMAPVIDQNIHDLKRFPTPGVRTIAALEQIPGGAAAEHQIKTMVMVLDGSITLALVRGDHQLNVQKLQDGTGATTLRPARPEEAREALGALPGSLGAVGVKGLRIVADPALWGRTGLSTGANTDDWHYTGVSIERDIAVDEWLDLREVEAGETCPACAEPLEVSRCIEAGHIFKLGTRYAEAMNATVLDADGVQRPLVMGSYGIGIERAVAALAETHHDEKGLLWPVDVAPFKIVITVVNPEDTTSIAVAEEVYTSLKARGIEVLLDDRDVRAGVKFADAELIGIPFRLTVGPRALRNDEVEFTHRSTGWSSRVPVADAVDHVAEALRS